ncbi:hypothetical protein Q7S_04805 [Rahnella aquatilis HX2]|nr:hypothetical protein Q7S_04805 [Rahnella aquatilis HX2]
MAANAEPVQRIKGICRCFPGRHIMAQASIEHSDIARPEHGHFITEKTTGEIIQLAFLLWLPEINSEAYI